MTETRNHHDILVGIDSDNCIVILEDSFKYADGFRGITGSRRPSEQKGRYMAKRISIKKKEDTCKTLSESQMAGLAVLIIRAADLSYIGRGTMGREKRRLPPPGSVTLF
jgi:hypothetical protein